MRIRIGQRLFLSHLAAILLVSGSIGTFFYLSASRSLMTSLQARLQNSAALVSRGLDANALAEIQGPADIGRSAYHTNLALLRSLCRTNPDLTHLYVMRRDADRVVFVLDSDDSPEQALPGQEYPDPPPSLIDGFLAPSADDRIYADQWGAFLSGYAPVLNGGGRYLVGLDMRADDVAAKFHELRRSGIISLVASLLFALLFGRLLARHLVRYIRILSDRCHAIAAGRLEAPLETRTGDELDQLVESFNTMSRQLHETRLTQQAAELALRRSRDELEVRVTERTRELTAANAQLRNEIAERQRLEESQRQTVDALQKALGNVRVLTGLLPICAQCKKIRNDQGYWTQVEEFVTQHSDAQFSHGLCPECAARLFPSHQQAGGDRDARTPAGAEP